MLLRIARGSNECQIEEFVLGAWPQQKKPPGGRRRRRRRHRRHRKLHKYHVYQTQLLRSLQCCLVRKSLSAHCGTGLMWLWCVKMMRSRLCWIEIGSNMNLWKLLHEKWNFEKCWICQSCYIDLLKLLQWSLQDVTWIRQNWYWVSLELTWICQNW